MNLNFFKVNGKINAMELNISRTKSGLYKDENEAILKDVHDPREIYTIFLKLEYVIIYLKILKRDFFQIFYRDAVW